MVPYHVKTIKHILKTRIIKYHNKANDIKLLLL